MYKKIAHRILEENYDFLKKDGKPILDVFVNMVTSYSLDTKTYLPGVPLKKEVPYCLAKCIKDEEPKIGHMIIRELDELYDKRIKRSGSLEDICQRYFHYDKQYLISQIKMFEKCFENNPNKAVLYRPIFSTVEFTKQLLKKEIYSEEELNWIINKLEHLPYNITGLCDDIEKITKQEFLKGLNEKREEAKKMLVDDIVIFQGEPFDFLIHSAISPTSFLNERNKKGFSTTLIDEKNICGHNPNNIKFIMDGEITSDELICASTADNMSFYNMEDDVFEITFSPSYSNIETFKKNSRELDDKSYSEINLKSNNVKPIAIVCYDNVREEEINLAKENNLKVVIIDTKHYPDIKRAHQGIKEKSVSR